MQAEHILNQAPVKGQTFPSTIYIAETEWTRRQGWREPDGDEAERAERVRHALVGLGLYPSGDLDSDTAFVVLEGNHRAALRVLIDEVSRTDLAALYQVTRLLALTARGELDEVE